MHLNEKCPQLIYCDSVYDFKGRFWVVLEFMDGGSMGDLIKSAFSGDSLCDTTYQDFSEDFIRWSLYQVVLGLHAMHEENILHRDVKSDNILFRKNGEVKLADLGFSVFLSE